MGNNVNENNPGAVGERSVEKEVLGFFREHPFLLVSESRLAALLCRPLDMVSEAVKAMEMKGLLARKDNQTLLSINENFVGAENKR
ncbi:MAG: hypothetical protein SWK76_10325 [Actinomycetota bacterium]|nr:hypothetical protein [Actinomycetota bacterium]